MREKGHVFLILRFLFQGRLGFCSQERNSASVAELARRAEEAKIASRVVCIQPFQQQQAQRQQHCRPKVANEVLRMLEAAAYIIIVMEAALVVVVAMVVGVMVWRGVIRSSCRNSDRRIIVVVTTVGK